MLEASESSLSLTPTIDTGTENPPPITLSLYHLDHDKKIKYTVFLFSSCCYLSGRRILDFSLKNQSLLSLTFDHISATRTHLCLNINNSISILFFIIARADRAALTQDAKTCHVYCFFEWFQNRFNDSIDNDIMTCLPKDTYVPPGSDRSSERKMTKSLSSVTQTQ